MPHTPTTPPHPAQLGPTDGPVPHTPPTTPHTTPPHHTYTTRCPHTPAPHHTTPTTDGSPKRHHHPAPPSTHSLPFYTPHTHTHTAVSCLQIWWKTGCGGQTVVDLDVLFALAISTHHTHAPHFTRRAHTPTFPAPVTIPTALFAERHLPVTGSPSTRDITVLRCGLTTCTRTKTPRRWISYHHRLPPHLQSSAAWSSLAILPLPFTCLPHALPFSCLCMHFLRFNRAPTHLPTAPRLHA